MRKVLLLLFPFFFCSSVKTFAQDTATYCDCYKAADTSIMQPVPLTLGTDSAAPPYYYNGVNTSPKLKLPFNFCFYGKNYDSVYIGNKGNISFIKPIHDFTTGNFPAGTDTAMLAPFWANICNYILGPNPAGVGEVFYKIYPTRLEVTWFCVKYHVFDCDFYDSFKLTITNGSDPTIPGGNNVEFCYLAIQWASADSSGGSMGFNGIPAMIGINKGDNIAYAQIGRFDLPGNTFSGITSPGNGSYWLNNRSFIFNTCVTEKNIPPVIINPDFCDTVTLCEWDTAEFAVSFLCAVPGQKATLSATSSTLGLVLTDTNTKPNGIETIRVKAPTNSSVAGFNTIMVTATDNSVPPQQSSYPIVFNVGTCTGVPEVLGNSSGFTVYPNANNGKFTLELNKGQTAENCEAKVYDITGKLVYSDAVHDVKTEIDITEQSRGMYFVKLLKNNLEIGSKKILIQ